MELKIDSVIPAPEPTERNLSHRMRFAVAPDREGRHPPFLVLVEDWFAPPAGFPTHPHRGFETVTFVIEGEVHHKDHTGASGIIRAGGAQFMTAGAGVLHSEMPGPDGAHTLQLWLNLPARLKRTPARYQDIQASDAAIYRGQGVEARVLAGKVGNALRPYATTWPMGLIDLRIERDVQFHLPVPAEHRILAYVLEGTGRNGPTGASISAGDAAWPQLSPEGQGMNYVTFQAEQPMRLLIYTSPMFNEPVVAGGPFVMNTQEEIDEAYAELKAGRLAVTHHPIPQPFP
jgi:redox-sensitive bicupin YhaK (pirin superfamily)